MTSVEALYGATNANISSVGKNKVALGKEDFLKLLLAQLQYQDPLEPLKNEEFVAQLSQFSSLEQLFSLNESLSYLQTYAASLNNSQAVNFIGKEIKGLGDSIYISADNIDRDNILYYKLAEDAETVNIAIYNSKGELVRTIDRGSQKAGEQKHVWDGKNEKGEAVGEGEYVYRVVATNTRDEKIKTNSYITGTVTGLTFEDGVAYLLLGNRKIALGNVMKVS